MTFFCALPFFSFLLKSSCCFNSTSTAISPFFAVACFSVKSVSSWPSPVFISKKREAYIKMIGAWWRKNVIEKVHAAAYSGRFTIKVWLSVPPRAHAVASACMLSCCSNTAFMK
jgi:hypothetical protein